METAYRRKLTVNAPAAWQDFVQTHMEGIDQFCFALKTLEAGEMNVLPQASDFRFFNHDWRVTRVVILSYKYKSKEELIGDIPKSLRKSIVSYLKVDENSEINFHNLPYIHYISLPLIFTRSKNASDDVLWDPAPYIAANLCKRLMTWYLLNNIDVVWALSDSGSSRFCEFPCNLSNKMSRVNFCHELNLLQEVDKIIDAKQKKERKKKSVKQRKLHQDFIFTIPWERLCEYTLLDPQKNIVFDKYPPVFHTWIK